MLPFETSNGAASLAAGTALLYAASLDAGSADFLPAAVYPGLVCDGEYLKIPLAALADYGLTAALADEITGDGRQVLLSLISRAYDWYQALDEDGVAPQAMKAKARPRSVVTYGDLEGSLPMVFECIFNVGFPDTTQIVSEPG